MAKVLGQVLMEAGMLTIEELNEALEIQKSTGQRLGDILIDRGILSEKELTMALEFQEEE